MKTVILLLALVLIVGGAKVLSGQGVIEEKKHGDDHHPDHGHSHSHHNHHQAPPLLEMLPPIGPVGFVLMGVMGDYYLSRYDHDGHGDDHDGHGDDPDGQGDVPDGHPHEGESRSDFGATDRETETTDAGQIAEPTRPISSHKLKVLHTAINPSNNHTYHLLEQSTWTAASAEAEKLGGHLVTVRNQSENDWIFSTFSNWEGRSRDLWMGYNDILTEGAFVWSNGEEASYSNWSALNPDNNTDTKSSGEDYVHMYGHGSQYGPGKWNDMFDARSADWSPGYYGVAEVPTK